MAEIQTGSLTIGGYEGISRILDFSMTETPGDHSHARITGRAARTPQGRWAYEGPIHNQAVTIFAEEEESPVYTGIIQEVYAHEENGVHLVRLELSSGTILMDMERKDHSYQDTGMSYSSLISQVAAQGGGGAVCPPLLDMVPISTPRIQYQETDWEFIKRMASHFGLPLYPEPLMGEARAYIGVPETGAPVALDYECYTAILDHRYYRLGGEESGCVRGQLLSYEVESRKNHRVGERTVFKGRELAICAKECRTEKGELLFTYRLALPEWAGEKRISNGRISGLSLLGTVLSRQGENLRLRLDIDEGHPDQNAGNAYPFPWVPATGNLMYLMPAEGSRVSLYFKNSEETGALAVNCIRRSGEGAGNQYRNRSLVTEHGKRLELHPCSMGLVSLDSRVMLDDLQGLSLKGNASIRIAAEGRVVIKGKDVSLETGDKGEISFYHGHITLSADGKATFSKDAEFHLLEEGKTAAATGDITYIAAYKHEDYSGPEYRFRDDPVEENYDYAGLAVQVLGGMVIVGGVTLLSGGIATMAGISATPVMVGSLAGGSMYVAGQTVTDLVNRQVSGMDKYVKAALAGSVIGALTGAAQLVPTGSGMLGRIGMDFATGTSESAISQMIMDGEIDAERMFREGLAAVIIGAATRGLMGDSGIEGGRKTTYKVDSEMFPDDEAAGVLRNGTYVKNPTAQNINNYISENSNYLGNKTMNGKYMYVVDTDGNIIIGTRAKNPITGETLRMPHPTLVGGANPEVQAAGMVEIRGGKIYAVDNASGHFKPAFECLEAAEEAFGKLPQKVFSKDFQGYIPYSD